MILTITHFKVKLIAVPKTFDEKEKKSFKVGKFTVGKKYRVYSIFDSGKGFTDFLVADNEGIFRWINTSIFRV